MARRNKAAAFILGDWNHDDPLHCELIVREVADEEDAVGVLAAVFRKGNIRVNDVWCEDDRLHVVLISPHRRLTVNLVLRGDPERIRDNARVEVYG